MANVEKEYQNDAFKGMLLCSFLDPSVDLIGTKNCFSYEVIIVNFSSISSISSTKNAGTIKSPEMNSLDFEILAVPPAWGSEKNADPQTISRCNSFTITPSSNGSVLLKIFI